MQGWHRVCVGLPLRDAKKRCVVETLDIIVEQGTARKPLTPVALQVSFFYLARSLLSFINVVLNATSKQLKRHLTFNLSERAMIMRFQKVPI